MPTAEFDAPHKARGSKLKVLTLIVVTFLLVSTVGILVGLRPSHELAQGNELTLEQRKQLYFEFAKADEPLWVPVDAAVGNTHLMRVDPIRWQAEFSRKTDIADKQQAELEVKVAAKYGIPAGQAEKTIRLIMDEGFERGWNKQLPVLLGWGLPKPLPKPVELFHSEAIRSQLVKKFRGNQELPIHPVKLDQLLNALTSSDRAVRESTWMLFKAGQAKTEAESVRKLLADGTHELSKWIRAVRITDDFDLMLTPQPGQEHMAEVFCGGMNVLAEYEHILVNYKLELSSSNSPRRLGGS